MSTAISAEAVKAHVPLVEVAGRDVDWDLRRSRPGRGDWWAPCPFHAERTASFHVVERMVGDGFFHCFGCGAKGGSVIDYIMLRDGLEFRSALVALAASEGVTAAPALRVTPAAVEAARGAGQRAYGLGDPLDAVRWGASDPRRRAWIRGWREGEDAARMERDLDKAVRLWREADPAHPLLVRYLDARIGAAGRAALWKINGDAAPPLLRLHPSLPYWEETTEGTWTCAHRGPAMLGLMRREGRVVGVHRTWIAADGSGRAKLRDKRILGAAEGASVDFGAPSRRMIVGEGIETTLAVLGRLARDGLAGDPVTPGEGWTAMCALSLGNIAGGQDTRFAEPSRGWPSPVPDPNRPGWRAPDKCRDLVILGDGDMADPHRARRDLARAQRRHSENSGRRAIRRVRIDWAGGGPDSGVDHADIAERYHA